MTEIYTSGNEFEAKTAGYELEHFNCSNDNNDIDDRSGKKGVEAENVTIGNVGEKIYAFIGLERIGGVMMYDVTNPEKISYANYINSRDFSADIAGDDSPEGLCFISESESVDGNAHLLTACEVSGTVALYELTARKQKIREMSKIRITGRIRGKDRIQTMDRNPDKEQNQMHQRPEICRKQQDFSQQLF